MNEMNDLEQQLRELADPTVTPEQVSELHRRSMDAIHHTPSRQSAPVLQLAAAIILLLSGFAVYLAQRPDASTGNWLAADTSA